MKKIYQIKTKVWLYPGKAGWYFVTIPKKVAQDIDFYFSLEKRGFGSLPVSVAIGKTDWKTSIFPDSKNKTYMLPIKKDVRQKEEIKVKDSINLQVTINL